MDMIVRTSRCLPLFAVVLLASASWTALPAQEPSKAPEASRIEVAAPGETTGVHTLTPTELETARRIVRPPPPIQPAQVHPGDHVASGISLRNRGGGVINLRGAPANATPVKALLY
jgi:hypothetical protein